MARHEANLTETTDVASRPEFASRRARKTIDGETHEGWFVDDFTLAELKTLRAVERLPDARPGSAQYNGMFQVATWEGLIWVSLAAQPGPLEEHSAAMTTWPAAGSGTGSYSFR